jgi:hypothetical protein
MWNPTALLQTQATPHSISKRAIPKREWKRGGEMASNGTDRERIPEMHALIGERTVQASNEHAPDRPDHQHTVDAWAAVAGVIAAMAEMQLEIDSLWRDAVSGKSNASPERLVEASHTLRRAVRVLEQDHAIG